MRMPCRICLLFLLVGFPAVGAEVPDAARTEFVLRKANDEERPLRNPVRVGDYTVVDIHDTKKFGLFLGAMGFTRDRVTGERVARGFILSDDLAECGETIWPNADTTIEWSANGQKEALELARKRCEAFILPTKQ